MMYCYRTIQNKKLKIITIILLKNRLSHESILEVINDDYLKKSGHLSVRQQYSETPGSNNWKLFNFALSFVFDST